MSQMNRNKIDWKSLISGRPHNPKKSEIIFEIKSYLQELAGHDILVSVICNDMQNSVCSHFLNYLQSGDLFWYRQLKQSSHVNLSFVDGRIKMLFGKNHQWEEVIVEMNQQQNFQDRL